MREFVIIYRLCRRETFKCALLADISKKSRDEATTRFRRRNIICLRILYDDIARSDAVGKFCIFLDNSRRNSPIVVSIRNS